MTFLYNSQNFQFSIFQFKFQLPRYSTGTLTETIMAEITCFLRDDKEERALSFLASD